MREPLQRRRLVFQVGFFALFILAPVLDILRIDLTRGHAVLFGFDWTLGIDALMNGEGSAGPARLRTERVMKVLPSDALPVEGS